MFYQNSAQIRSTAKSLLKALKGQCPSLTLGQVLDAMARTKGYANWSALNQALSVEAVTQTLSNAEQAHMFGAQEADLRAQESGAGGYGDESILQVHTGFLLKVPAYPQECDYVRVCDPFGREVAYWTAFIAVT